MSALPWAPVRALDASGRGLTESRVDADLPPSRLSPAVPRARARVLRTTTKRTRTRERKPVFAALSIWHRQPSPNGRVWRGWRCEGGGARGSARAPGVPRKHTNYIYKRQGLSPIGRWDHRTAVGTARQRADGQPMRTPTSTIVMSWMMYRTALSPATESCKLTGT